MFIQKSLFINTCSSIFSRIINLVIFSFHDYNPFLWINISCFQSFHTSVWHTVFHIFLWVIFLALQLCVPMSCRRFYIFKPYKISTSNTTLHVIKTYNAYTPSNEGNDDENHDHDDVQQFAIKALGSMFIWPRVLSWKSFVLL